MSMCCLHVYTSTTCMQCHGGLKGASDLLSYRPQRATLRELEIKPCVLWKSSKFLIAGPFLQLITVALNNCFKGILMRLFLYYQTTSATKSVITVKHRRKVKVRLFCWPVGPNRTGAVSVTLRGDHMP